MSNYESTRDSAALEEAKNVGQEKAGQAQQATKVSSLSVKEYIMFYRFVRDQMLKIISWVVLDVKIGRCDRSFHVARMPLF